MAHRRKRQFNAPRASRPVQKTITRISLTTIGTTLQTTAVGNAVDANTVTGWWWDIGIDVDGGTAATKRNLCVFLFVNREETIIPVVSFTNETTGIRPEQAIIAFKYFRLNQARVDGADLRFKGHSKTMRKLQAGDDVDIGVICDDVTNTCRIAGSVMLFAKH